MGIVPRAGGEVNAGAVHRFATRHDAYRQAGVFARSAPQCVQSGRGVTAMFSTIIWRAMRCVGVASGIAGNP